jgi:hypothetical protein
MTLDSTSARAYAAGVKFVATILLLGASLAFAQDPPPYYFQNRSLRPEDALKKESAYAGKAFDAKAFDAKGAKVKTFQAAGFPPKDFKSKDAPVSGFPAEDSRLAGREHKTAEFKQPPARRTNWWQRLFSARNDKANTKVYPATNFPTRTDAKLQEKIERMEPPKTLQMPTITPTPETINKPR